MICQGCDKADPQGQAHDCLTCNTCTPIRVGAIFVSSWGYDQTNTDFYQVTRVSPSRKSVWLRKLAQTMEGGGPGGYRVMPMPGRFLEWQSGWGASPAMTEIGMREVDGSVRKVVRVIDYGKGPTVSLTLNDVCHAYLWDGEPEYATDTVFGH